MMLIKSDIIQQGPQFQLTTNIKYNNNTPGVPHQGGGDFLKQDSGISKGYFILIVNSRLTVDRKFGTND